MDRPWWTLSDGANADAGAWPQCESLGPGHDYAGPRSPHRMPDDALPGYDPDFGTSELEPEANLTDFISSCIHTAGFLVSGRVRELLSGFALPAHQYYPAPVRFRSRAAGDYWRLHLPQAPVVLTEAMSPAEAEAALAAGLPLDALDLVRLYRPARYAYCFVSDRLRRSLQGAGITGVRLGRAKLFRLPRTEIEGRIADSLT